MDTPGFKDTEDAEFVDELMNVLGDEVSSQKINKKSFSMECFYFAWYINIFNQFLGERGGFFFNRLQVQRPVYTTIQKNTHHVNKNVWKFLDQCCNRCEFLVFQKGK